MPDDSVPTELQPAAVGPIEATASAANSEPPSVVPPKTTAPVNFNQQNNFYQRIPTSAWDRLSNEQVVDLSKQILKMNDDQDERHGQFSKKKLNRIEGQNKGNLYPGSFVILTGFGLTGFLAMKSHEFVALTISLPLATTVAMLAGNRMLK